MPDSKHVQQVGSVKRYLLKRAHFVKREEAVLKELQTAGHAPKESLLQKLNPRNAKTVLLDGTNHKKPNQARPALPAQQDGVPFLTKRINKWKDQPCVVISNGKKQKTVPTISILTIDFQTSPTVGTAPRVRKEERALGPSHGTRSDHCLDGGKFQRVSVVGQTLRLTRTRCFLNACIIRLASVHPIKI